MKPGERQPFDPDGLRQVASDKVFACGQGYADNGHIALLRMNDEAVLAAAFGSDDYTVWLEWPGRELSGRCTCPAYDVPGSASTLWQPRWSPTARWPMVYRRTMRSVRLQHARHSRQGAADRAGARTRQIGLARSASPAFRAGSRVGFRL